MSDTEVQPGPETGAGDDDVRAVVAAAFEQHSIASDAPDIEAETSTRARNERGQFTRADGAETLPEPAPVSDADPDMDKPEQPSTAALEPPKTWSADEKAKWSTLDPAIQAAIARRDVEIDNGGRQWSEQKRGFEETLAPVRVLAQQHGIDEREAVKRLANVEMWLRSDPKAALGAIAQAYGIDFAAKPNDAPQPQADPLVTKLQTDVQNLLGIVQNRERAEAAGAIEAFAKDPAHPHFEAVKAMMGSMISSGYAADLQDAYDKAVWSDPSIRSQLIASQTASAETERRARERETAERAKRAAISVSGSSAGAGAPVPKPEYDTVDAAARAAWRQHAG